MLLPPPPSITSKPPPDWEIIYFNETYNSSLTHIIRGIYTYGLLFWQLNDRTVSLITQCVGQVTGWVCTCVRARAVCVCVFRNYMTIKYSAAHSPLPPAAAHFLDLASINASSPFN